MENKEQIDRLKYCYELCVEANFDDIAVRDIAIRKAMSVVTIRRNALIYMSEYLKVSKDEINKYYMFFLPYELRTKLKKYKLILEDLISKSIISPESITDVDWLISSFDDTIEKYCYELCKSVDWNHKEIEMIANSFGVSLQTMMKKSKKYSQEHFNTTEEEWRLLLLVKSSERNYNLKPGRYVEIFDQLLETEDEQEIITILSNTDIDYLRVALGDYLIKKKDKYEETKVNLTSKLNLYSDYKRQKQKKEQQRTSVSNNLKTAQIVINEYINYNSISIASFCKYYGITKEVFMTYTEVIKLKDPKLYNCYSEKAKQHQKDVYQALNEKIKNIIELITNGIQENGKVRPFDILDYYSIIKLDFPELVDVAKRTLDVQQLKVLKKFIVVNKNMRKINSNNIRSLLNEVTLFGAKTTPNGEIIPGTGTEVTKEEKKAIINYLRKQGIPLYNRVYHIALRRYVNGELSLTEPKKKILYKPVVK